MSMGFMKTMLSVIWDRLSTVQMTPNR
jgi:hypothetical protein